MLSAHPLLDLMKAPLLGIGAAGVVYAIAARTGRMPPRGRIVLVGLLGTVAAVGGWLVFLVSLHIYFPHVRDAIPLAARLESFSFMAGGAFIALFITLFLTRNSRNMALASSTIAAGASCMVFAAVSGIAQPFTLAYELSRVVVTMLAGGLFAAVGIRFANRPDSFPLLSIPALGFSVVVPIFGALSAILPFADWVTATRQQNSFALHPLQLVFVSELVVMLTFALAGAGVDRQNALRVASENTRLRELTDNMFEALLIHRKGVIVEINQVCSKLFGWPAEVLVGSPIDRFLPGLATIDRADLEGPHAGETTIMTAGGESIPVETLSQMISFGGNKAQVTALRDIRSRRAAEEKIRFLAHHDALTKLPNRLLLQEALAREIAAIRAGGPGLAIFYIDLDRFKSVNDTLGHQIGDKLLQMAVARILSNIRDIDLLCRIGGDEFVLLQPRVENPEIAGSLATRINHAISQPYQIDGHAVNIGASIGIALGPQDGTEADKLIGKADVALYRAKADGRNRHYFFRPGMDTVLRRRRVLEQELSAAIEHEDLTINYQPVVTADCQLVGFEALLRWTSPTRGSISPDEFIPIAEETGLIVKLGAWVLDAACQQAVSWGGRYWVAVNVSPRQLTEEDFPRLVAETMTRAGLAAHLLELEVTEGVLLHDNAQALKALAELKHLGLRISLDDFGTGYSGLSSLHHYPFDKVKIDRSFIARIADGDRARAIVAAVLAMSRQLGLTVTAEGIETATEFTVMRDSGCDLMQGNFLSPPICDNDLDLYIKAQGCRDAAHA
jgi:diguanylate cyclase (GGDEF)-like protein/PAS domain S-box-containing protein